MLSALEADGGCFHCIELVLRKFLNLTSWELLKIMDQIAPEIDFGICCWEECRPIERHKKGDDEKQNNDVSI